jgi:hypothetical protein
MSRCDPFREFRDVMLERNRAFQEYLDRRDGNVCDEGV